MISGHVEDRYKSSWTIIIEQDREDGQRDRATKSIKKKEYKTRPEAERFMNRLIIEMEQGTYVDASGMTLSAYLDKWLDFAKTNLGYTTHKRYKGIIENYFKPELGFIKLENLKPLKIQEHYKWLQSGDGPGLSPTTVHQHHAMLHKALKQARRWQLIQVNPADNVDPPSATKYEAPILPDKKAFLDFLEMLLETILYLPAIIALATSLRRGEVCALRWQDVDWDDRRLLVRHSLYREAGAGLKLKSPKNGKARPVKIPAHLLNILRREFMTRYEETNFTDHGNDYICAWEDGRPIEPSYISHRFGKMKMPITFHGCRHSHDTWMLRQKVDPKIVADIAGRDVGLTQRLYEHVLPDMQEEAAALFDETIFGLEEGY